MVENDRSSAQCVEQLVEFDGQYDFGVRQWDQIDFGLHYYPEGAFGTDHDLG